MRAMNKRVLLTLIIALKLLGAVWLSLGLMLPA
jgi:hypothetical protein